jgi:glucose/arabinose dehydrogenase
MSHSDWRPSKLGTAALVSLVAVICGLAAGAAISQMPEDLQLEPVVSGLTRPVAARHAGDGSGRLFIVEQAGRILIFDGNTVSNTPFLDIRQLVDSSGNEQGLLGLDFHPDYASNGYFFVNYTRDPPGTGPDETVIARYTVSPIDPQSADPTSATEILLIDQDASNHNGGDLHFGPDGYLYFGLGDGGGAGDPNNRAQDLQTLLGKLLRIDVDSQFPYAVPPDNPFVGISGRDEIWAYGLRNPWRWSFDRQNGDLMIGDVGQNTWEEVDWQPAASSGGQNYGWDCFEGSSVYTGVNSGSVCPGPTVTPILEYSHGEGDCSITGGYVYRGSRIVGLQGYYLYGDYCTGRIWLASPDNQGGWSATLWQQTGFRITSFGEDEQGEIYLVERGGTIYRFASPGSIFTDGFELGNTSAWSNGDG